MSEHNEHPVGVSFARLEELRMELWMNVAVAVARSDICTKPSVCGDWADRVLVDFDKRFHPLNRIK